MKKLILLFLLIAMLTMYSQVPISSNDSDDVPGSFTSSGYNNPVEITNFIFNDSNGDAVTDGSSLSPQGTYYFKLDITEYDTLADIERVQIIFYEDSKTFGSETSTTNTGDYVIFEWNRTAIGDSDLPDGEVLINFESSFISGNDSDISWQVINKTGPSISANDTDTTVSFEVEFKISKVAREGSGNWQFGLNIDDGLENPTASSTNKSGSAIRTGNDPLGGSHSYSMDWYGEISIPDATVDWSGEISPGSRFNDANSELHIQNIKYISNGSYAEEIAVEESWTASGAKVAGVTGVDLVSVNDLTTNDTAQTFALKINGSDDLDSAIEITPNDSIITYSDQIAVRSGESNTTENGNLSEYYLYLSTSTELQNATYTGNLKFVITND